MVTHLPENQASVQSRYQKHQKIYPKLIKGKYTNLRVLSVFVLLGLYFGFPWITWSERQAVLFDLPGRKFYYFGVTFWPQDFFYLASVLIILAFCLFFFTAIAGRLWCGYSCPQTVWTEVYLWLEHLFEGDRNKRIKLDKAPMTHGKWLRKLGKHSIWLFIAFATGFTFVGYFTPIMELTDRLMQLQLSSWESFWILFFTFATYGNAGWMREQVCIYMCPYARFQSSMFDKDTLIISYDEERGEPRGSRKRGLNPFELGKGACIDCKLCVQVCPTGIDIREGLQYQCIGCAACVDVCNQVMDKMEYKRGLIRYTTEHQMHHEGVHLIRPRVLLYGFVLLALIAGLTVAFMQRIPLELDIIRDRNALYREASSGLIENVFTLKILNMDQSDHRYDIYLLESEYILTQSEPLKVKEGQILSIPVQVTANPSDLKSRSQEITFVLQSIDEPSLKVKETARFIGPIQ